MDDGNERMRGWRGEEGKGKEEKEEEERRREERRTRENAEDNGAGMRWFLNLGSHETKSRRVESGFADDGRGQRGGGGHKQKLRRDAETRRRGDAGDGERGKDGPGEWAWPAQSRSEMTTSGGFRGADKK